jgi:hypothetical protein
LSKRAWLDVFDKLTAAAAATPFDKLRVTG